MVDVRVRVGVFAVLVVLLLSVSASTAQTSRTSGKQERERLQRYLTAKGLFRLQVRSVEIDLANELDVERRKQLASKLANDYQAFFLSQHEGAEQDFVRRAKQLMRDYPETSSPELRLAIQHSTYLGVERDFQNWWQAGSEPLQRANLSDSFFEIRSELQQLQRQNQAELEQVRAGSSFEEAEVVARLTQSAEIEARILHAKYLQGWTNYFLGVIAGDQQKLVDAENHFRSFLQLDEAKSIQEFDKSWFDFSTIWNSRALVGLALVFQAQKKPASSAHCFKVIDQAKQDSEIIGRVWRYRGIVYAKQWNEAAKFVKENSDVAEDDGRFWQLVLDSSKSIRRESSQSADEITRQALERMAGRFEAASIAKYIEDSGFKFENDSFTDLWLQGYLELYKADSANTSFDGARTKLKKAMEKSVTAKPTNVLHCKFLLASINFHQKQFESAKLGFDDVVRSAGKLNSSLRAEARWMKIRSLIELSRFNSRYVGEAFEVMKKLSADPAGAKYKSRVEFEELRLAAKLMPPEEAVRQFAKVSPQHSLYMDARFEMLFNQFRAWQQNRNSEGDVGQRAFAKLVEMQKEFCSLSPPPSIPRQAQAMFYTVEAGLGSDLEKTPLEQTMEELSRKVDQTNNVAFRSRLNFYWFAVAKKFEDTSKASTFARLLVDSSNVKHKKAGLVHLAKQFDFVFDSKRLPTEEHATKDQLSQAADIYQKLSELLGSSEQSLAENKNATLTASRLVDLLLWQEQVSEAVVISRRLSNVFPENQRFVAQYARALSKHGKLIAALPSWRKISRATQPGQELWFEAKFWVVKCLATDDPSSANSILRQTINLSGELPEPWKSKFAELQQSLAGADNSN